MQQPIIADAYLEHCRQFVNDSERDQFLAACARPLRPAIRVNRLRMSVPEFYRRAEEYGWKLSPVPWCEDGFWIDTSKAKVDFSPSHSPEHLLGAIYIQEASSMLPPVALFAQQQAAADSWVMDMAAAPGSKTTQLAAMMNNQGLLLANELSASRLKSLHGNLLRMGVSNTYLSHWDATNLGRYLQGHFDFVLLDAPCGGEGTVRKDPEALKNWSLARVNELASLQKALIESAYQCLRAGGYLVYSTCTLSHEENHQVVAHLLQHTDAEVVSLENLFVGAEKALSEEGYLHILPHIYDSEGFFVALLRKPETASVVAAKPPKSSAAPAKTKKAKRRGRHAREDNSKTVTSLEPELKVRLEKKLSDNFGWNCTGDWCWYGKERQVWLVSAQAQTLSQLVKLNRLGLLLGEWRGKEFRLSHEAAMTLGNQFTKQKIDLTLSQLAAYMRGENLQLEASQVAALKSGECIVTFNQQPVGLGLLKSNLLKNNLARHLVMDKVNF